MRERAGTAQSERPGSKRHKRGGEAEEEDEAEEANDEDEEKSKTAKGKTKNGKGAGKGAKVDKAGKKEQLVVKDDKLKLTIEVLLRLLQDGRTMNGAMIDSMVQGGASWKQGRPPKGAMERGLESWLEELLY